jgi:starch-binding outer membrane protein, SusD/RagB family
MRLQHLLIAGVLLGTAACDSNRVLDVDPTTSIPDEQAIVNAQTARAALAGAYNALQDADDGWYYAETFIDFGDLRVDNAEHIGTFTQYQDNDDVDTRADDTAAERMWDNIYEAITRANVLIARVPSVADLDAAERDNMLGQAHFLRALSYHNLMKHWAGPIPGNNNTEGVPLRLEPVTDLAAAANIQRATRAEVYTQILADLQEAATLLAPTSRLCTGNACMTSEATRASFGAVKALETRVHLYREDYANALAAANAVLAEGYALAANFGDLFTGEGTPTSEDIFRIIYTPQEASLLGFYYLPDVFGGRWEIAPTQDLYLAYEGGDERRDVTVGVTDEGDLFGAKYPTSIGSEDFHAIRLAEIILTKAEVLARQSQLALAVDEYNRVRARAGLTPHILGVTVANDQAAVLAAIWKERRLEFALEGERFAELVRTGQFLTVMGLAADRAFQSRYPIPQNERDVTNNQLTQNPGY